MIGSLSIEETKILLASNASSTAALISAAFGSFASGSKNDNAGIVNDGPRKSIEVRELHSFVRDMYIFPRSQYVIPRMAIPSLGLSLGLLEICGTY